MKYVVEVVQERNMGEYAIRARESLDVVQGEPIEALIKRAFHLTDEGEARQYYAFNYADEIVIRVVRGSVDREDAGPFTDPWAGTPPL